MQRHQQRPVGVPYETPADRLLEACHIWFQAHLRRPSDSPSAYWARLMFQTEGMFKSLANRAAETLCCDNLSVPSEDVATHHHNHYHNQNMRASELEQKMRVISFLRALAQCGEIGLDLCKQAAKSRDKTETMAEAMENRVLNSLRPFLWRIMAELEPYLFWDARPFWTGLSKNKAEATLSAGLSAWKVYVRLFILACFDQSQVLRTQRLASLNDRRRHEEEEEEEQEFDPRFHRRPIKQPTDLGLGSRKDDEHDDGDAEIWPMSMLFSALDAMADEWTRTEYTGKMVRLIARCLLRYAVLAYARSSSTKTKGLMSVHDMPDYCINLDAAGLVGVDSQKYYGQGGAMLRDMLSDMCLISHADAWMYELSSASGHAVPMYHKALAPRLWLAMRMRDGTNQDVLMQLCLQHNLIAEAPWPVVDGSHEGEEAKATACFRAIHGFLSSPESRHAESCFTKTGIGHLIQPGEVWRFVNFWPHYRTTPLNVMNALRERDMTLYRDKVMIPGAASLVLKLSESLPGALIVLVDNLVWESVRHMMRMVSIEDATEGFTNFMLEKHHVKCRSTKSWEAFRVWSSASSSSNDVDDDDDDDVYKQTAILAVGIHVIPPFPQLILLGGRQFLWNPLSPVHHHGQASSPCVVTDISGVSAAVALEFWLQGRIAVTQTLMQQEAFQSASLVQRLAVARLKAYRILQSQWFSTNGPTTTTTTTTT